MADLAKLLLATAEQFRHPSDTPLALGAAIKLAMGKGSHEPLIQMIIPDRQLFIRVFRELEDHFGTSAALGQWLSWAKPDQIADVLIEVAGKVQQRKVWR